MTLNLNRPLAVLFRGLQGGGGLVYQLKKSYSLTDLVNVDEADSGVNAMVSRAIGFVGSAGDGIEPEFGEILIQYDYQTLQDASLFTMHLVHVLR